MQPRPALRSSSWAGFALLCLFALSCSRSRTEGDPGGGPDNGKGGTLQITPADAVLDIDGKASATLAYQVRRGDEDVTDRVHLYVDDARLGSFSGATFTSVPGAAGRTMVRAQLDSDTGSTSLTLRVKAVVIAPGAPADAPDRFGGPNDPGKAPELVYPPDGVLVPPNLNVLEFQWRKQMAATLFEVSLLGEGLDLRIYTTCQPVGSGCALVPDEPTWGLMAQAARGRSVKWTVRGTGDGGGVGAAGSFTLSFSEDDMKGGLYYWGASAGGIFRYDFGLRGQKAEAFYTPLHAVATCVGCHALSRNGKRIAVGMNIPGPAMMRTLDVSTRTKLFEVPGVPLVSGSDFQAFTADGERLVTVERGGLTLRRGDDGTIIGQSPAVPNANMPDFSPDGKSVVFARGTCPIGLCPTLQVDGASLHIVPFQNDAFGTPTELVPQAAGQNNYYPSFSPDGRFVVFNRAAGGSYDAPDARVMIVPAAGGAPIDLGSVNGIVGNSWPKWSPFVHRFRGATIFWLTFSSRRAYGLRQPAAAQLWMVPVDVGKLAKGEDPGLPPFWLPFQDIGTGNHIAQWVEKVDRAPCSDLDRSKCQANEMCVNGMCVPGLQ